MSCGAVGSLSGCLSRAPTSPHVSESAIADCEVSYIEETVFDDDDPPPIDASVESTERYDDEYYRVTVESHWLSYGRHVETITLESAGSPPPENVPSSSDGPFADLDAFDDTLSDAVDSGEEVIIGRDHDEFVPIRDAFLEAFEIEGGSGTEPEAVVLDHDGDAVEAVFWVEVFHGDGENEAFYFVSETETYRVEEYDGGPADGTPMHC